MNNRYIGFINLADVFQRTTKDKALDFIFPENKLKGGLIVYCYDRIYILSQSARGGVPGRWTLVNRFDNILGLDLDIIKEAQILESPSNKLIFLVNKKYTTIKNLFEAKQITSPGFLLQQKESKMTMF